MTEQDNLFSIAPSPLSWKKWVIHIIQSGQSCYILCRAECLWKLWKLFHVFVECSATCTFISRTGFSVDRTNWNTVLATLVHILKLVPTETLTIVTYWMPVFIRNYWVHRNCSIPNLMANGIRVLRLFSEIDYEKLKSVWSLQSK